MSGNFEEQENEATPTNDTLDASEACSDSVRQPNFQLVFGMDQESYSDTASPSPLLSSFEKQQHRSLSDDKDQLAPNEQITEVIHQSLPIDDTKSPVNDTVSPANDPISSANDPVSPANDPVSPANDPVSPANDPVSSVNDAKSDTVDSSLGTTPASPTDSISSIAIDLSMAHHTNGISYTGIQYLGSSTVDAPVSETEANRKMHILKSQCVQTIPVTMLVPTDNNGSIVLKDPTSDQVLVAFFIRHVLFCARGQQDTELSNCIAINVLHKRSGLYHCHIFTCDISECQKIFEAIGRAFKTKPPNKEGLTQLVYDLDVMVEIQEEDGKGNYSGVSMDKDCFKIRSNVKKKLSVTISQTNLSKTPLNFEKCFGLLIGIGHDIPRNKLHLLDNAQTSSNTDQTTSVYSICGFWDTTLPYLAILNEDTSKSAKYHILTVATDVVATNIVEPIRITREIKVRCVKSETFSSFLSTLTRRKHPIETFTLSLDKIENKQQYKIKSLKSTKDSPVMATSSPTLFRDKLEVGKVVTEDSPLAKKASSKSKQKDNDNEESEDDDDEYIVSGWGDEEQPDLSEDLLKQWHFMLDKWDGRDKWEPKGEKTRSRQLIKLVRKGIPGPLRCQLWQMLSGADNDPQLIEAYRILFTKESPTENVINWDIKRTFVGHEFFQESSAKESLYKISKAYSVYDSEVGYCQGFSFMAAVLLLQKIPEEQAFAILVKIMFNYGHRNVFKANFQELHLMFYQLEKLMEEYLHELYEHFMKNSLETHMYASQWFLTLFTAKFPLHVTYHIMDIYLCEGTCVIFQIALSLLKLAQKDLLCLDFEGILNYFRATLPKNYANEEDAKVLFDTASHYSKINQRKLKKLEKDYQVYLEQQALLEDPHVRMERENKQLRETVLRLQRENDDLAEELVSSKVALRSDMDRLEERIDELSKECRAHRSSLDAANLLIAELREELQHAKQTYQKAMIQLMEERQQHDVAIAEYRQVFHRLDEGHQKQKEELNQELLEVKAKLGSSVTSDGNHQSSLTSEQRLRQVELELAQTKLALVEAQCKNQELDHKIIELTNELSHSRAKPSWLSRFS